MKRYVYCVEMNLCWRMLMVNVFANLDTIWMIFLENVKDVISMMENV